MMSSQRLKGGVMSLTNLEQPQNSQTPTFNGLEVSDSAKNVEDNAKAAFKSDHTELAINNLVNKLPELDKFFHIHRKVGEGTFSNVYLASLKSFSCGKMFAIKHLIPTTHPKRMKYELECLQRLGGQDNIVSCDMTFRRADNVVFIMPYLQHQKFSEYVLDMTVEETRMYMENLLRALRRVHSFNIIHRDVKPSNFLYNRETKQFLLVDFGLAQKVNENENNQRMKPPFLKTVVVKRKLEDDNSENVEKPQVKRIALQTLPNDAVNKPVMITPTLRVNKQPQSTQMHKNLRMTAPDKSALLLRKPLTANCSNIMAANNNRETGKTSTFQNLMPQKATPGASYVRVQNSKVQVGPMFQRPVAPVQRRGACDCDSKPRICNHCLTRKAQYAPRAGTPGFRPPEVLLKYTSQTTAVDMWSAGVIMMCILSGCYPFFRSPDDITALSELIAVFGSEAIIKLAKKLGRNVVCSEVRAPVCLWVLCEQLRRRKLDGRKSELDRPHCADCRNSVTAEYGCLCLDKTRLQSSDSLFPSSAFDLLRRLLDVDPTTRISAEDALKHPFITGAQ